MHTTRGLKESPHRHGLAGPPMPMPHWMVRAVAPSSVLRAARGVMKFMIKLAQRGGRACATRTCRTHSGWSRSKALD